MLLHPYALHLKFTLFGSNQFPWAASLSFHIPEHYLWCFFSSRTNVTSWPFLLQKAPRACPFVSPLIINRRLPHSHHPCPCYPCGLPAKPPAHSSNSTSSTGHTPATWVRPSLPHLPPQEQMYSPTFPPGAPPLLQQPGHSAHSSTSWRSPTPSHSPPPLLSVIRPFLHSAPAASPGSTTPLASWSHRPSPKAWSTNRWEARLPWVVLWCFQTLLSPLW